MGLQKLSHKTIKSYMTGVRSYYVELEAFKEELKIFHTLIFERIIACIRQFNRKPNVKERHLITQPVLCTILTKLDKNTQQEASLYAAFCFAFAGFFSIGEFTWACRELNANFQNWYITQGSVLLSENQL